MSMISQPNSGDDENIAFSSTVHKLIIVINVASIGLLQVVVTNESSASTTATDRDVTILWFCIFLLIFALLRVFEVKLRSKPRLSQFLGYISHLFGALAALMIFSNFSTIFTIVAASLWIIWFFVVIYISFAKLLVSDDVTGSTDVPLDQLSPV